MIGTRKATVIAIHVLAFLLVLAVLYVVLRDIGFRHIVAAMKRAGGPSVRACALLHLVMFVFCTMRWQLLMKPEQRHSIALLFPIYMASVFGNTITPGARVGGEAIRAYYMSRAFGGEATAYLGTVLADKFGSALMFFGYLFVAVTFVVLFVPLPLASKVILEGSVLLVVAAVVSGFLLRERIGLHSRTLMKLLPAIYQSRPLDFLRRRFRSYQHFEEYAIRKLDNIFSPIRQAAVSPRAITYIALTSTAAWLLLILAHSVLFQGLGVNVSFLRVLIIVSIATFFGDIAISPGGAGVIETAMIGLCAAFGIEADVAAAVTLIGRGMYYAYGLVLGGLCLAILAVIYPPQG
jgi:hypothetical protein